MKLTKTRTFLVLAAGDLPPFFALAAAAADSFLAFTASAAVRGFDDAVLTTAAWRFFTPPPDAFGALLAAGGVGAACGTAKL